MVEILQEKREAIVELCARHGVARLDVFGSVLRDDFRPGEVDLVMVDAVKNRYIAREIARTKQLLYAA